MRTIALMAHPAHSHALSSLRITAEAFSESGIKTVNVTSADPCVCDAELLIVFGGDGTVLSAAEYARPHSIPILGINYGHVGFLNEADPDELHQVIEHIVRGQWQAEERMTIDVTVHKPDGSIEKTWALNEAAVNRAEHARMLAVDIAVDAHDVSSFKADSIVMSTPTGSTAYNFSGGGPIVWPDVECMIFTPIAAHALFARPLVIGPQSTLEVRVQEEDARVACDGRRYIDAPVGSRVHIKRGEFPIYLARLENTPFSARLVTKFQLPVRGWRG